MRNFSLVTLLALCVSAVGCCGPMGMGPGCAALDGGCYDCDGGFGPRQPIATGPIDALRNLKRSMVCGGGCGEVYYGEWRSTPPDCADPCQGSHYVGGAAACTPFCWQPGALLGTLAVNLYGQRFNDGSDCGCAVCDSCGCDDGGDCGCGGDFEYYSEEDFSGETMEGPVSVQSCPSCAARKSTSSQRSVVKSAAPAPHNLSKRAAPTRNARAPMSSATYR